MSALADALIRAWTIPLADAYHQGQLVTREMMQAVFFQALQGGYPPRQVWLSVPLVFEPGDAVAADHLPRFQLQQWLSGRQPAILITEAAEVKAVVELLYSPGEYGDFRHDMRRLMSLYQLRGQAALYLQRDPYTGQPDVATPYDLASDLLCAYGIITRASGLGLQTRALLRTAPEPGFKQAFLHLGGAVAPGQAVFFHTMNDVI